MRASWALSSLTLLTKGSTIATQPGLGVIVYSKLTPRYHVLKSFSQPETNSKHDDLISVIMMT